MKSILTVLLIFVIFNQTVFSDDDRDSAKTQSNAAGFIFGYNYTGINEFSALSYLPVCCTNFTDGTGDGVSFGLFYEYQINDFFKIQFRYDLLQHDMKFINQEFILINVDTVPVQGLVENVLNAKMSSSGFSTFLSANLFREFHLSVGARLGFLSTSDYDYYEKLVEPADVGVFPDSQKRTRNEKSGTVTAQSRSYYQLVFGAKYYFPMNEPESLKIVPEFNYHLALNSIYQNTEDKINSYFFAVGIYYYF